MKALRILALLAVSASVLMLGGCAPQAEGTEGTSLATNTPATNTPGATAPATTAPATNEAPATNAPATNEAAATNSPEASTNSK